MKDPIDDSLNGILGRRKSPYTLEQIQAADKLRRKNGGTLLDTLQEMTQKNSLDISRELARQTTEIQSLCDETNARLDAMELRPGAAQSAAEKPAAPAAQAPSSAAFDGLAEVLAQQVFGQESFLKKLVIAWKRPLVLPPEAGFPRNSIYLTGPRLTGRHFSLTVLAAELKRRNFLLSDAVVQMDLSLYPTAGEEKLFLQDLYAALRGEGQILVFEHFESCHPAFLHTLSLLVTEGSCPLSARYVLQNGQLVAVNGALAAETVRSLSAEGKYLVFLSDASLERLAGSFGAPFVSALGDVCETAPLSREAMSRIAAREQAELVENSEKHLSFTVSAPESLTELSLSQVDHVSGLSAVLNFYGQLYRALAQQRLEQGGDAARTVALAVTEGRVTADFGSGPVDCLSLLPAAYSGDLAEVKADLQEIVGLKEVKEYVLSLEEHYAMQQLRRRQGLKTGEVNKHMIFTGNPGTGKTTIARIVSRYLKAIGVLSGGQLIEVSRVDLVGRYVGHTAPLTNQVIASALGGVLFIDEAYSLYRGQDDSFGLEAIDTLVKGIEDNRDDLVVILAGYSKEMAEFLTANSGLKSRFPNLIRFPDYTGAELLLIAKSIAKGKGYVIDAGCETPLLAYFNAVQAVRAAEAGNGRLARNKVEEAILKQSGRLAGAPEGDLSVLLSEDFDLTDVNG